MDPVKLFTVIVLISLPTVMFGGYALLDLLSKEKLTEFQRTYFRAGHAHAGVLLVMTLVALAVLDRTEFGDGARWVACILLAVGVLAQSGGMFLHMAIGKPGAWSRANTLTTAGAVALAAGMQVPGVFHGLEGESRRSLHCDHRAGTGQQPGDYGERSMTTTTAAEDRVFTVLPTGRRPRPAGRLWSRCGC